MKPVHLVKRAVKASLAIVLAFSLAAGSSPLFISNDAKAKDTVSVYRLSNPTTGRFLYTLDSNEVKTLVKTGFWNDEGVAWEAPTSGDTPVYRLYNSVLKDHFFASSEKEASMLDELSEWSIDNKGKPVFYSDGKCIIYRLYNAETGVHIYTSNYTEYELLKKDAAWTPEPSGIRAISTPTMPKDSGNTAKISSSAKSIDVDIKKISHKEKDIYTPAYQEEADGAIAKLKAKDEYTFDNPLVVANPYGTYTTSLYYYAKTDTPSYARLIVKSEGASDINHRLMPADGADLTSEHEYQITGLVPGQKNQINIAFYDAKNKLIEDTQFTYTPGTDTHYIRVNGIEYGNSKLPMTEGFFYLFGHDKKEVANIYVFDNEGMPRGLIPLNKYRSDRFLFIDDYMAFSYDTRNIALMNRLGKIEKFFDMPGFKFHHDYNYDPKTRTILCLANGEGADTIEDRIVGINVDTGEVKELVDFQKLLPEIKAKAVQREGGLNTYGGTELDWLHLNAISLAGDGQVVVSSREHSSIYKVSGIYTDPKIDYIIHDGALYSDTKFEDLRLKKIGDFVGNAGQHCITYQSDPSLPAASYYLYMYNNNFANSATLPDFDWSGYVGAGTYQKGDHSSFYKYLVDEKAGTYKLVNDVQIPYSSIVSNVQEFGDNIAFSSGMNHSYGEYDSSGNMIRIFRYDANKYAYRIMKYDMEGMYYND